MNGYEKRTQNKKEKILNAAQELLFSKGYIKMGIAEIANKAKVSQVTIYNYYGGKEALLIAVFERYINHALDQAEAFLCQPIPFKEKMDLFFTQGSSMEELINKDIYQTIPWDSPRIQEAYHKVYLTKGMAIIQKIFDTGKQEGYIDPSIPNEALIAYMTALKSILTHPDFLKQSDVYKNGINRLFYYGIMGK